jgi:hypothetical protein
LGSCFSAAESGYAGWDAEMLKLELADLDKHGADLKILGFSQQELAVALGEPRRQAEIMKRIASEFGFTPASRSRISASPKDQLPLFDVAEPEG